MSDQQFSEEQMRALEAEMDRITVDDVLLQTTVTLINLAARKAGLGGQPGETAPAPDWEQVREAIEAARALLPLLEPRHGDQLGPIRDTLARLQMVYAQQSGGAAAAADGPAAPAAEPAPSAPAQPGVSGEEPGPAQRSGRLWVPGQ